MLQEIKCPQCHKSLKFSKIEAYPIPDGSHVSWSDFVFLCPHCDTVLGKGIDPEAVITEIEIPARKTSSPDTSSQQDPVYDEKDHRIDWPVIRTQNELAEIARLQHNREHIYPLQGKPVGEILMHYGAMDEQALRVVCSIKNRPANAKKPIGETLVDIGIINQVGLTRTLLIQAGIPMVDVLSIDIPREIIDTIPPGKTREKLAVPIGNYHNTLYLCVSDPFTYVDQSFFTVMTGMKVILVFAPMNEIVKYIDDHDFDMNRKGAQRKVYPPLSAVRS